MALEMFVAQKLEIERVRRTLDIVKSRLSDFNYAIVGSYSRRILEGNMTEDHFNKYSDLDVAVQNQWVELASDVLMSHPSFNKKIEVQDYIGSPPWPIPPPKPSSEIKEFLISGELVTPVHLVGSYTPKQKEGSIVIGNVRYLVTKLNPTSF